MTQSCEDSHSYIGKNERGKRVIKFDTRKFYQGRIYDGSDHDEEMDWAERAKGIVDLGLAVSFDSVDDAMTAIKKAEAEAKAEATRVEKAKAEAEAKANAK